MFDTRLVCLIVAVSLVAVSTAKPSYGDGHGEAAELKQLLGAMKRYLHVKDDGRKNGANAHDDIRTFYASCEISALIYKSQYVSVNQSIDQ